MEMDFIRKEFNLNFSKFLNHFWQNEKITMDYLSFKRLIDALVLNVKTMYPARVKVRKKDISVLEGKQQKCRGGAPLNCHSKASSTLCRINL